jgi:hypothetical protein
MRDWDSAALFRSQVKLPFQGLAEDCCLIYRTVRKAFSPVPYATADAPILFSNHMWYIFAVLRASVCFGIYARFVCCICCGVGVSNHGRARAVTSSFHFFADKMQRANTLAAFRDGKLRVLMVSEVAARGIDVVDCDLVSGLLRMYLV